MNLVHVDPVFDGPASWPAAGRERLVGHPLLLVLFEERNEFWDRVMEIIAEVGLQLDEKVRAGGAGVDGLAEPVGDLGDDLAVEDLDAIGNLGSQFVELGAGVREKAGDTRSQFLHADRE